MTIPINADNERTRPLARTQLDETMCREHVGLSCSVRNVMQANRRTTDPWPSLLVEDWAPTRDTLHMWTQIVGKVRLEHMPLINHWWQVTLYVSARGLTTGSIPYQDGVFDIEFDFVNQVLAIRRSDGNQQSIALEAKPVAEFYGQTLSALDSLGIESHIVAHPNE